MNRRHNRFVVAAAVVTTAAVLVSPAGAATTAWTSQHLTKAVKSLVGYRNMDSRRDSRQGWKIKAVAHTNFLQTGKLHRLAAFRTSATGRLSGLEAQNVIQAELNGGILDTSKTVELPVGSPGAPHGGWMMFTRDGDCYVLYNGAPGVQGRQGRQGRRRRERRSRPQRLPGVARRGQHRNGGRLHADHHRPQGRPGHPRRSRQGRQGRRERRHGRARPQRLRGVAGGRKHRLDRRLPALDRRPAGAEGRQGRHRLGRPARPGQSAYQAWLSLGNCGSVADFVHSLIGPQGPKGDRGATGATGPQGPPISTQLTTVCVILKGQSAHLGVGAECNGHEQIQVYVPAS